MDVHVTGGAGFIGSNLVRSLVERGHDVTVFDNISRGELSNIQDLLDEIRFVEGDIRNPDEVDDAIRQPDVVYHLAAVNGTKNFYERPYEVLDTNIRGVKNVVEVAMERDVNRLIFSSSSEVYGYPEQFPTDEDHTLQIMDPENPRFSYAGSKIVGEQYVVNGAGKSTYDYTILRPHNIYGEAMGYDHVIPEFVEQIVTDKPFTIYGDGEQTRSFCYITDAVDAFIRAAEKDRGANEIFNIGTQEEVTINTLAQQLFDIAGVCPPVEHTDSKELRGSTRRRQPKVSKARELIGYDPDVSLNEGLERTFSWYCKDFTGLKLNGWREQAR